MYSTSQLSVNDIFWCLGFPKGKSDYSITKKKRERERENPPKEPKMCVLELVKRLNIECQRFHVNYLIVLW